MKNTIKAESFASVIIVVIILSITALGIFNILSFDKDISYSFSKSIDKFILKSNAENIAKKLYIPNILEKEEFFIYKNKESGTYELFTGSLNKKYKYIDNLGNLKDSDEGNKFSRSFIKNSDIIKDELEIQKINKLVMHFDATTINGISNGSTINILNDLSKNALNGINEQTPSYMKKGLKGKPSINFEGDDKFLIANNDLININTNGYEEKSIALVLKTGADIKNEQIIYEQGSGSKGYSIYIKEGKIEFYVYNDEWINSTWQSIFNSFGINLVDQGFVLKGKIIPNSSYFIILSQNSRYSETDNDNFKKNNISMMINGKLIGKSFGVPRQTKQIGEIGLGGINVETRTSDGILLSGNLKNLKGQIGEFIYWNKSLSISESKSITNYLMKKWGSDKKKVKYEDILINIEKIY